MKQRFLSKTAPSILFLRLSTFVSSKSDHHDGYGFVLAYTSVIWVVPFPAAVLDFDLAFEFDFFDLEGVIDGAADPSGSTWTISSQT